jgi:hypothetical protein
VWADHALNRDISLRYSSLLSCGHAWNVCQWRATSLKTYTGPSSAEQTLQTMPARFWGGLRCTSSVSLQCEGGSTSILITMKGRSCQSMRFQDISVSQLAPLRAGHTVHPGRGRIPVCRCTQPKIPHRCSLLQDVFSITGLGVDRIDICQVESPDTGEVFGVNIKHHSNLPTYCTKRLWPWLSITRPVNRRPRRWTCHRESACGCVTPCSGDSRLTPSRLLCSCTAAHD